MFTKLGDGFLQGDGLGFAFESENTLNFGYPTGYDGRNIIFYDSNMDSELYGGNNPLYIWKYHPWLQFYLRALSFGLLGITTFAARLPNALFGILSLTLLYFFVIKITNNKKLANLSILLLAFFTHFYLYSIQPAYYSQAMFFSLLVLFSYIKFIKNEKHSALLFILSNILLFHTNYIPFFSIYLAMLVHIALFYFRKDIIKKVLLSSFFIILFTLPWFLYANIGTKTHAVDLYRILFGISYLFVNYIIYVIPLLFLFLIPKIISIKKKNKLILNKSMTLIILVLFCSLLIAIFSPYDIPSFRHLTYLFPIIMLLNASVILSIRDYSKYLAIVILLILVFTNFLHVLPFKPIEKFALNKLEKNSEPYLFVKDNLRMRYFVFDYLYMRTHSYERPHDKILMYFIEHGEKDDVFITNSNHAGLMFYTDMIFYRKELNKTPDWIIPRKPNYFWGERGESNYNFAVSFVNESYEKIIINSTDYIYPVDNLHPRVHRFKENKEMKTSNLYPYETYPIEIYRLKD